jgi:hypothetical protein
MFSRQIKVEFEHNGHRRTCDLKWLDSFSMRNFTNDAAFDDTLPVADGLMQIGRKVPLEKLRASMEDWFQRKSYIGKQDTVIVSEVNSSAMPTPNPLSS